MRKLIKHLKPFVWSIVAIFVLLFAQAMADLSLPGYMANIVNVGIQQNGIENSVPEAISTSEFNKLTLFMTDSEKAQVTGEYILLSKQNLSNADYAKYLKTYPQLATTPLYKLNTTDKTKIAQLNTILVKKYPTNTYRC
jgi:ATP-binding cassette subfamily B multidrug efflux pump